MNPDEEQGVPYVPPMHLGTVVGSASDEASAPLPVDEKHVAEIDRRIAELETEEKEVGVAGKLRIEQTLEELFRERRRLMGEPEPKREEE